MQFELPFRLGTPSAAGPREEWLRVGQRHIRLRLVRNDRARRYILRLHNDGTARVTIPRRGSPGEATRFAARNASWLEKQLLRLTCERNADRSWHAGTHILFRGERVLLEPGGNGEGGTVRFGTDVVRVTDPGANLRPELERYLWKLSGKELTVRTIELAKQHNVAIRRVTVRNQRSRWGSCSRRGTISLNWRLIQAPVLVRDYLILHELAHVKEMNHSRRFWREVERLCPDFAEAERWLRRHSSLLR
jgi:predicted metal-dependent hydrolase